MPQTPPCRAGIALVIGVGDYLRADRVNPLRYAKSDADALARALTDPLLCGFPPEQVLLLTDANARRDEIVSRLSTWLPERARGSELVVVYFAGHGRMQRIGSGEEGFLLPYDADPHDLDAHGIAMRDLARWIDGIETRAVVVCLDCCHAGKLLGGRAVRPRSRNLELTPQTFRGLAGRGRYLIASCDQGQKSYECEERRHGLFTYHLLQGIEGAADADADGRVGLAELFNYVSAAVCRDAMRRFGACQKPWTSATWADETYISYPGIISQNLVMDRLRNSAAIAPIFRNLAHEDATIRAEARSALQSLGWDNVVQAVEGFARQEDAIAITCVLEGLNAFETHPLVVGLLDRLVALLRGELRNRAILLLERKRLGLELERVAAVFRDVQSPYQPHKALGQGLCTNSYLARAEGTELDVVVRVLRPEIAQQPQLRAAFLDLCRQSLLHVHENLVLTREVRAFPDRDVYYCVRDYVHGVTLQTLLDAKKRFELARLAGILLQTAAALAPLHRRGLFHGGIKPSNIFLCPDDRVVLGDPCLHAKDLGITQTRLSYDYRYTAPEVSGGKEAPGPAADWYALGCVAYELFCGKPPFVSDDWRELAHQHAHTPIQLSQSKLQMYGLLVPDLLTGMLAKAPADRLTQPKVVSALTEMIALVESLRGQGIQEYRPPRLSDLIAGYQADQSIVGFEESLHPERPSLDPIPELTRAKEVMAIPGYEILEIVGRGAMGVVYKARQVSLDRLVAFKTLPFESARLTDAFKREAKVIAQLKHPNIVQVYDSGVWFYRPYLAMEFIEGHSLAQRPNLVLLPRDAATLVRKIALAVHYAHERGIIHRDLKPGNILLDGQGEPHLTDFGLALDRSESGEHTLSYEGTVVGTPTYMAPEQALGVHARLGPGADIWALGVILFELLTGSRPFAGKSIAEMLRRITSEDAPRPRRLNKNVPSDLEAICLKALERDLKRRYGTARDMASDLERWLRDGGKA